MLDLTARMGLEERVWYSSFNHYTVQRIKELNPQAKTGMLYCDGIVNPVSYGALCRGRRRHASGALQSAVSGITWKTVRSTESAYTSGR